MIQNYIFNCLPPSTEKPMNSIYINYVYMFGRVFNLYKIIK